MQDTASTVTQLYHIMDKSTHIEILGMEEDLTKEISQLKHCQDALIKAVQRKRGEILAYGRDEYELMKGAPEEISQSDIHQLANLVKKETQSTDFRNQQLMTKHHDLIKMINMYTFCVNCVLLPLGLSYIIAIHFNMRCYLIITN